MKTFRKYLDELKDTSEAEIIPFPNPKTPIPDGVRTLMDRRTFQDFVNDVFQLLTDYDMKYNHDLNQIWLNELYSLNCKEKIK